MVEPILEAQVMEGELEPAVLVVEGEVEPAALVRRVLQVQEEPGQVD
jgi:hypothetical protein